MSFAVARWETFGMRLLAAALVWVSLSVLHAGGVRGGTPLVRDVLRNEYKESGVGFELVFDSAGVGYLAARHGLFRIDGSEWKRVELGGRQKVYSVDRNVRGRVYIGLFGDFGYVDVEGGSGYHSLFSGMDSETSSTLMFDRVIAADSGVYARAVDKEYFWDASTGKTTQLAARDEGGRVFSHRGDLYLLGADWGLSRLEGGNWIRLSGVWGDESISPLVTAFSEERDRRTCLVLGGRWLYWFDGLRFSLCTDLGEAVDIRSVVVTQTGNVIVGIPNEGVRMYDLNGSLVQSLAYDEGLLDASMIDLAEDIDGRIWIVQERGISIAQLGNAITLYNSENGLEGQVQVLCEFEGNVYAGTSLGLFRKEDSDSNEGASFRKMGGVGECKSLETVGSELLVGSTYGLYIVKDDEVSLVYPKIDSTRLKYVSGDPGYLLVGSTTGLLRFSRVDGEWVRDGKWGYEFSVYAITPDGDGNIWLDAGQGRARRMRMGNDGTQVDLFTAEHGLTEWWTSALEFNGRVVFTTKTSQLLGYNEESNRFELQDDLAYFPPPGPYVFKEDLSDGDSVSWAKHSQASGSLAKKPAGNYGGAVKLMANGSGSKINGFITLRDGTSLFGLDGGIIHYDESFAGREVRPFETWISEIVSTIDDTVYYGPDRGATDPRLEFEESLASIRVSAKVNKLQLADDPRYEYVLTGPRDERSGVVDEPHWEYRELPAGVYMLEVTAFNDAGERSNPANVTFEVLPPFYRTKGAFVLYVLLGVGALFLIGRIRTMALKRSNEKLVRLVDERTRELELKNERLANMNDELREMAKNAQEAAAAKASFLAVMSHEIRTPLNGVLGMCSVLEQTGLNAIQREYLNSIHASGQNLLEVVNDILDFSRIEKGRLTLENIPFDIVDLAEGVISLLGPKANEKKLGLLLEIDQRVKRLRDGDPTRVRQILYNLLGNSIKFTNEGSVSVSIYLKAGDEKGRLYIKVTDTGVGIDAEKLDLIFEAFAQSDVSDVRKFGGTGLGLSICRQIAQMMGGSISVESRLGEGSSFEVCLVLPELADGIPLWSSSGLEGRCAVLCSEDSATRNLLIDYCSRWNLSVRYLDVDSLSSRWRSLEPVSDFFIIDTYSMSFEDSDSLVGVAAGSSKPVILLDTDFSRISNELNADFEKLSMPIIPSRLLASLTLLVGEMESKQAGQSRFSEKKEEAYPKFEGLSVLVAEDNQMNQEVVRRLLINLGVKVTVVSNGADAVAEFEKRTYDLVLMDVQMPVMGGFEATQLILKGNKSGFRPLIYCLTAGVMDVDVDRCRDAGMLGFIGKPFSVEDLVEALKVAQWNRRARLS